MQIADCRARARGQGLRKPQSVKQNAEFSLQSALGERKENSEARFQNADCTSVLVDRFPKKYRFQITN